METLKSKNHPNFCAKYIKHVGTAKCTKVGWTKVFLLNGKYYMRWDSNMPALKVGQKVWVAKKVKLPNDEWAVCEVELPECYWHYSSFMMVSKSVKQQWMTQYVPQAKMWYGGDRVILQPVSEDYVRKLMKQYVI